MASACDLELSCHNYTWLPTGRANTQVWARNGRQNTLIYDAEGRVSSITNGLAEITEFDYTTPTSTTVTDGRNLDWTIEYISPGVPTVVTNPAGGSTTYTYTNGLRTGIVDANGVDASLVYIDNPGAHDHNQLQSTTNGAGDTTYYRYETANYANIDIVTGPSHICDARSANATDNTYCTERTYESSGRKISERVPGETEAEAEEWQYSQGTEAATDDGTVPAGLLWEHRDGNVSATGGEGITQYRYDSDGDLVKRTSPSGLITTWTHDGLGRDVEESVTYSDNGAEVTKVVGVTTYDQAGQIETVTGPVVANPVADPVEHQLKTSFGFDEALQKYTKTESDIASGAPDPGRTWTYKHDALDREIEAKDPMAPLSPDHHAIEREYDANGNVTAVTDAAGNRVETTYNNINLPVTVTAINFDDGHGTVANRVLSWSGYDPAGQLTETKIYTSGNEFTHTKFEYDDAGRLLFTTLEVDGAWHTIEANTYTNGLLSSTTSGNTALTSAQDKSVTTYTYWPNGEIHTTTTNGRLTTFTYDTAGNITSLISTGDYVLDGANHTTTSEVRSEFDSAGNAVRIETENGNTDLISTFVYDERGLRISTVGPRGNAPGAIASDFESTSTYDELGRPATATGTEVNVEYASNSAAIESSWVSLTTAPTAIFGYDTYGNTTHTTNTLGETTETVYDLNSRRVQVIHPSYSHPANGTLTPIEAWTYDPNGNVDTYTSRLGNTTSYTFDGANRVVTHTDPQIPNPDNPVVLLPAGITATYYDTAGRETKTVSPEGAVTEQNYNSLGLLEEQTVTVRAIDSQPAQTAITAFEYSWLGFITKVTDPTQIETTTTYDAFGSPLSSQVASFAPATYLYDGEGRLVRTINSAGQATTVTYDQVGRSTSSTETGSDAQDYRTTSTTYDEAGLPLTQTTGRGGVTSYQYNSAGLLTNIAAQVDDASTIDYSYGYDVAGNVTRVTDGDGLITRYMYNEWGLMTHTLEPKPSIVSNEPESARRFIVGYNEAGQSNYEYSPGGRVLTRSYNDLALPVLETTTQTGLASVTKELGYDRNGQTTHGSHPSAPIEFVYDDRGLLVTQTGGAGTASYTYDEAGRTVARDDDAANNAFGYAPTTGLLETITNITTVGGGGSGGGESLDVLFLVDNPASLTTTENRIKDHLTDADHTVTIRDAGATEETNPGDLIIVGHAGGLGNKYEAQAIPILELQPGHWDNHELTTGSFGTQWSSTMVITDPAHDLAAGVSGTFEFLETAKGIGYVTGAQIHADAELIAETNVADRVSLFGYETGDNLAGGGVAPARRVGLSGLHNSNATPTTEGWLLFDAAVSWVTNSASGGSGNTTNPWTLAGETYTYDNRGNRLTAGSEVFTYDHRNRLLTDPEGTYTWNDDGTLEVFTPSTGPAEEYTFDAATRLTEISDGTNDTNYTYDGLDRISTRDGAAFTYSGAELDPTGDGSDLFHRTPNGELLAYETGTETTHPYSANHHDLNGLFTSDGSLTDSQTYDPYGDPVASSGSTNPVLGYQSDYTDPDTDHVWMGARWYQPSSATFISRDTVFGELRTPFTLNRYTYAINNPNKYWDPDGRYRCGAQEHCTDPAYYPKAPRKPRPSDEELLDLSDAPVQLTPRVRPVVAEEIDALLRNENAFDVNSEPVATYNIDHALTIAGALGNSAGQYGDLFDKLSYFKGNGNLTWANYIDYGGPHQTSVGPTLRNTRILLYGESATEAALKVDLLRSLGRVGGELLVPLDVAFTTYESYAALSEQGVAGGDLLVETAVRSTVVYGTSAVGVAVVCKVALGIAAVNPVAGAVTCIFGGVAIGLAGSKVGAVVYDEAVKPAVSATEPAVSATEPAVSAAVGWVGDAMWGMAHPMSRS